MLPSIYQYLISPDAIKGYSKVIVLGLIFGLQIVMLVPLSVGILTTPFSITYRAVILGLSLLVLIRNLTTIKTLRIHKGFVCLMIFWTIYLCRLVYDLSISGVYISPSLVSASHIYQFAIGSTFIPLLALSTLPYRVNHLNAEKGIFWFSLVQSVSIAVIFFGFYGISIDAIVSRHLVSTVMADYDIGTPINPITISRAGGLLAVSSIVCRVNGKFNKLLKVVASILGIVLLVLGASRGPFVASFMSLLLLVLNFLFFKRKNFPWLAKLMITCFFVLALVVLGFQYLEVANISLLDRSIGLFQGEVDSSTDERFLLWQSAYQQFCESPIIGDKFVEDYQNTYPHNIILEVLMSVGILGFLPLLLALIYAFKRGIEFALNDNLAVFVLFFYVLIGSLFSGSIFLSSELWVAFAFVFLVENRRFN